MAVPRSRFGDLIRKGCLEAGLKYQDLASRLCLSVVLWGLGMWVNRDSVQVCVGVCSWVLQTRPGKRNK